MALVIVATVLTAASKIIIGSANNTGQLSDRMAAQWVALNQLTKLKIGRQWPINTESGDAEMMRQTWQWKQRVKSTEDDFVLRVEVDVRREGADEDDLAASVTGFIAKPPAPATTQ